MEMQRREAQTRSIVALLERPDRREDFLPFGRDRFDQIPRFLNDYTNPRAGVVAMMNRKIFYMCCLRNRYR